MDMCASDCDVCVVSCVGDSVSDIVSDSVGLSDVIGCVAWMVCRGAPCDGGGLPQRPRETGTAVL